MTYREYNFLMATWMRHTEALESAADHFSAQRAAPLGGADHSTAPRGSAAGSPTFGSQQHPQHSEGRARRVVTDRELAAALGLVRSAAARVVALEAGGDHVAGDAPSAVPYRLDVLGGHQARIHGVPIDSDPRALAILHDG